MLKGFPAMVCGVVVALLLITTLAIPVISTTQSNEDVTNPDEHGIVLGRITSNFDDVLIEFTDNGDDTFTLNDETYDVAPMILTSSDNLVIFIDDNGITTVLGIASDDSMQMYTVESFILDSSYQYVVVTDQDNNSVPFKKPTTFFYYPDENGEYSSWTEGNLAKTDASPVISVGSFAGVGCYYNNKSTPPLMQNFDGLMTANAVYTPTLIESVTFVPTPSETPDDQVLTIQPFDPSVIDFDPITINPLDPIDIGGGENVIMAVPTPTYTDGDWGFDVVQGNAIIVSYSGAGGGAITIPATVSISGSTVPVKQVGKGSSSANVFDTSLSATDLIISEGIEKINNSAFNGCSGFTGTLTLPSTLNYIGSYAFNECSGFTGSLVIPNSATDIRSCAFFDCSGFTGSLVIPDGVTQLQDSIFYNCSGLTGTLTLPSTLLTTGSQVFSGCGFTGSLVIPDGVTHIGGETFKNCSGFTGTLLIPDGVTTIGNSAFRNCSGLTGLVIAGQPSNMQGSTFQGTTNIKQVLNLGTLELTTTSYGLNADEVRQGDDAIIESSSYIAPLKIEHPVDTTITTILNIVPILLIAGIILAVTGFVIYRRF